MYAICVFIDMILSHAWGYLFMSHVNGAGLVSLYNGAVGSAHPSFNARCLKWDFSMTWLKMLWEFKI